MSLATKGIGPLFCTISTFVTCCLLWITSSYNHLLPLISVPPDFTLLKTTCQILLLLIGFDTLTYRKDYDSSPILVGHKDSFLAPLLLLLLVACYKSSHHTITCYRQFQCLQIFPCWKPLVRSFCSSLGSTLLLIERTTIDPLYLWVISETVDAQTKRYGNHRTYGSVEAGDP